MNYQKKQVLNRLLCCTLVCCLAPDLSYATAKESSMSIEQNYSDSNVRKIKLDKAIEGIEKASGYIFIYKDHIASTLVPANIIVKGRAIKDVLDELLRNTGITYKINNRQIVLNSSQPVNAASKEINTGKSRLLKGIVLDENNIPAIGVNIYLKDNPSVGSTTDIDGNFSIKTPRKGTLIVSYIGYKNQEVELDKNDFIKVSLVPDTENIEEVVVTAFGVSQKKESLVGSIQQIKPGELTVPSSSLSSGFAGRMAGVIAVQRSGEPGADGSNFWIRGKSTFSGATGALIILDGVEISTGDLNALDPEVIESFSILKDATATALYGTRGANGVMIVTTKQGQDLQKPAINFRFETAINQLTKVPDMVDGVRYMQMYNEAVTTRNGADALYTDDKIQGTLEGRNPYLFPNVNWYNEMFKPISDSERFNFNIRGGRKVVTYFMSAAIKRDGGNMKSLSKDYFSFNNNINVIRYDFVNNLNIKATPSTNISLGLNVSMRDWSGPVKSTSDIFSLAREASPVDFPVSYPQLDQQRQVSWGGMSGGVFNGGYRNPVAELVTGYKSSFSSTVNTNFRINQDLSAITKGLKMSGLFSFKNYSATNVTRTASYNQYEIETLNPETDKYTLKRIGNEQNTALGTTGASTGDRRIYIQAIMDYTRTFGVHNVNGMLLYNQDQFNTNLPENLLTSLPKRKQGFAGRMSYNYDNRYMTELNFGYNGSENFAKGHRYGFFPSIAVGYTISEEKFWSPLSNIISFFKLRGSWGLVGNDAVGGSRFAYLEDIQLGNGNWGYTTGVGQGHVLNGPIWNRYFNPNLTWEIGEKVNFGFDSQIFHDFRLNMDLFSEIRSNIYVDRTNTIPSYIGTSGTAIFGNVGKVENKGIEVALDYNKQISKNFFMQFKGTFTFVRNKVIKKDEPPFALYPNLQQRGHSMDQPLIYISNGLFIDPADIAGHAEQTLGYIPMPGDIKYMDIPNVYGETDGIIDGNDKMYYGNPTTPEIIYGFGPSMRYKNWDCSFFFQGAAKVSILMSGIHPFGKNATRGVMDFIAKDYWSEANPNPNSAYPRLTRDTNDNNNVSSLYWLRNGAFLKLKNAEIGYTYKMFRAYLSGTNLLTFSPFKYWDPEMGSGNGMQYPTQRTYNLGIQFTFK